MSLATVKALISRASKDPQFRERFASHPEEVMSEYDLTTEERDAMIRTGMAFDGVSTTKMGKQPMGMWV